MGLTADATADEKRLFPERVAARQLVERVNDLKTKLTDLGTAISAVAAGTVLQATVDDVNAKLTAANAAAARIT